MIIITNNAISSLKKKKNNAAARPIEPCVCLIDSFLSFFFSFVLKRVNRVNRGGIDCMIHASRRSYLVCHCGDASRQGALVVRTLVPRRRAARVLSHSKYIYIYIAITPLLRFSLFVENEFLRIYIYKNFF